MYYSHPHFADEVTEAGESELSRVSYIISSRATKSKAVLTGPQATAQVCTSSLGLSVPSWWGCSHSGRSPSLLLLLLQLLLRLRLLLWPQTRSFVSTLSCSGRPPRALPCFVFVAGPTTDALLAAQLGVQPRLPLSLSSWPAALVRTEKVGRGQLAEATEIAAHDSHRSSRKVGTQDPTVC